MLVGEVVFIDDVEIYDIGEDDGEEIGEDEYEDIQDDLEDFVKRHKYRAHSFFETKADLIESYLPDK